MDLNLWVTSLKSEPFKFFESKSESNLFRLRFLSTNLDGSIYSKLNIKETVKKLKRKMSLIKENSNCGWQSKI